MRRHVMLGLHNPPAHHPVILWCWRIGQGLLLLNYRGENLYTVDTNNYVERNIGAGPLIGNGNDCCTTVRPVYVLDHACYKQLTFRTYTPLPSALPRPVPVLPRTV